jgi:hypothetical protein
MHNTLTAQKTLSDLTTATRHWILVFVALAFYFTLFTVYYPPISGIEDEIGFVNQALVWSRGAISAEGAGFQSLLDYVSIDGRQVARRNPGRSLIILPFILSFGLHSIFFSGALVHAALTLVAARIHVQLHQSPLWSLLVLFHPTLSIYSRTIMGDAPAGLFLILSLLAVVSMKRPGLWAGLFIGISAIMRYQAGLVAPFFVAAIWRCQTISNPRREAIKCLAACGAVGGLIGLYNIYVYHDFVGLRLGLFSPAYLLPQAAFYSLALTILWPAMLPVLLIDQSDLARLARAACLPIALLCCSYYWHDTGTSWAETLVLGQRLLQCVLPIWIVAYASFLNDRVLPFVRLHASTNLISLCLVIVSLGLMIGEWYTFQKHENHLNALKMARDEVITKVPAGSMIVANYTMEKLFGVADQVSSRYHWLPYLRSDLAGIYASQSRQLHGAKKPWFLALLHKQNGEDDTEGLEAYSSIYRLEPVTTLTPNLKLYMVSGQ